MASDLKNTIANLRALRAKATQGDSTHLEKLEAAASTDAALPDLLDAAERAERLTELLREARNLVGDYANTIEEIGGESAEVRNLLARIDAEAPRGE